MKMVYHNNQKIGYWFTDERYEILRSVQDVTEDTALRDALAEIILDSTEHPIKIIKCRPCIEDVIRAYFEGELE